MHLHCFKSFEFFHVENCNYEDKVFKNIHEFIEHMKARMKGIEEQIDIFTTTILQTQTRLSAMSKDVYKNPAYGRHQLSRPMQIVGPIQM